MKTITTLALCWLMSFAGSTLADVPQGIAYQGRMTVNGEVFDGPGQFKFALVNAAGTTSYWSNNGTSVAGSQPTASVSVTVSKGNYSVTLGASPMSPIPDSVLNSNTELYLRLWFNDGVNGWEQLGFDQKLTAVPYARVAAKVPPGAVTATELADGAVASDKLADGSITQPKIAAGTLLPRQNVAGTTQAAQPNKGYLATNESPTTFTLPLTANVGDVVEVTGGGTGGWLVQPGAGQEISAPWVPRAFNADWFGVASSADGTKLAAAAYDDHLYTSTDSGLTWTRRDAKRRWRDVACSADGTKLVAVAYNDRIYTSVDSGATWTPRESNRIWVRATSSADGTKLAAVEMGGRIYTSTDSGVNWTPREGVRGWYDVASSADGTKLAAVVESSGQIYTSTDSGVNWTPRESNRVWSAIASSTDGTKLVAVVQHGRIYTSTDSGVTWTARESSRFWYDVASSADGTRLFALVAGQQIYTSIDSGVTWQPMETNQSRNWSTVTCSTDGKKLVAGVNNGQIFTSDSNLSGRAGNSAKLQYLGNNRWTIQNASLSPEIQTQIDEKLNRNGDTIKGALGIGRAPVTNQLEVEGNASKSAAGDWLSNSDRRIKRDIQPVTGALDKLGKVRLVDFEYTDDYRASHPGVEGKRYLNVVAQEFAEVFPEHVKPSGEKLPDGGEILQVDTYPLTTYSAAAVQELHAKLKAKDQLIEETVKGMDLLKQRIEFLETQSRPVPAKP